MSFPLLGASAAPLLARGFGLGLVRLAAACSGSPGVTIAVSALLACGGPGEPNEPGEPTPVGQVRVRTWTAGTELDPDGYVLSLGTLTADAGLNDAVTFENVPLGQHRVELGGLAANCTATDGAEAEVELDSAAVVDVTFNVTCYATTGSLRVVITTTGFDLDADGYDIGLDGGLGRQIGPSGSLLFPQLAPGQHSVVIDGVAANCSPEYPADAAVVAGEESTLPIAVRCTGPMRGTIVMTVSVFGSYANPLFTIQADGNRLQQLTRGDVPYGWPAVSPDAREVAVVRGDGANSASVAIIGTDGELIREVVPFGPSTTSLVWGPNGRLFFARSPMQNQWPDLCSVNVDGTGYGCVQPEDGRLFFGDFALSPDGQRVVYSAAGSFVFMEVDGSNIETVQIETGLVHQPDWSPDGSRIVYQHVGDLDGDDVDEAQLFVMNADGTGRTRLSSEPLYHGFPRWSPDGREVFYLTWPASGATDPKVMEVESGTVRRLLPEGTWGGPGTWSPLQ
jgi:hypothetical protein